MSKKIIDIFKKNLFIAEIGVNHSGDINLALEHIQKAKESGFNAVKFQLIDIKKIWHANCDMNLVLSKKEAFQEEWFKPIKEFADALGMIVGYTPTFQNASSIIKNNQGDFIKIASPQFEFDKFILDEAIDTGLPLIVSNGYSDLKSTKQILDYLINSKIDNSQIALLYCVAKYPADNVFLPYEEAKEISKICERSKINFGFSDHYKSILPALELASLGAKVFEKHFVLEGIKTLDSQVSIESKEAIEYIKQIKFAQIRKKFKRESTMLNKRYFFCSSLFLKKSVKKGETFDLSHFNRLRMGKKNSDLETYNLWNIIKKSNKNLYYTKDIKKGEMLYLEDIN